MPTMLDALYLARLQTGMRSVRIDAAAGYIGGTWPSYAAIVAAKLGIPVFSIAVASNCDADILDVESGDATDATVVGWFNRQKARGSRFIGFYTSVSNANALVATLTAAGIPRSAYWLWLAHYGAGEHLCSPACYRGNAQTADATQWADSAPGPCDQSILTAAFLAAIGGPSAVQPPASPQQTYAERVQPTMNVKPSGTVMVDYLSNGTNTYVLWDDGSLWCVRGTPPSPCGPVGQTYWAGRKAATLKAFGVNGVTVVATSGETYTYGA